MVFSQDDDNDADSILVSDTGNTELMYCAASGGVRHTCWYRTYIRKIHVTTQTNPRINFKKSVLMYCSASGVIRTTAAAGTEHTFGKYADCLLSIPFSGHNMICVP